MSIISRNKTLIKQIIESSLQNCLNKCDSSIPYDNEKQFQFDLAWRIKEEFAKNKTLKSLKDNINFETHTSKIKHLTPNKETTKYNKIIKSNSPCNIEMYTDLVIYDDDYYIAIELKYKKIDDGAQDEAIFDYIWDAQRLEMLKTCNGLTDLIIKKKYKFGYAVLLTEDNKYWKKQSFDNTFVKAFGNIVNKDFKIDKNKKYNYTKITKTIENTKRDIRQYPIFKKGLFFSDDYYVIWDLNKFNSIKKFHIATIKID